MLHQVTEGSLGSTTERVPSDKTRATVHCEPRGGRMWSRDSYNQLTFQDQEVWIQGKQTALWAKYQWAQWACKVFDKTERAWQLK